MSPGYVGSRKYVELLLTVLSTKGTPQRRMNFHAENYFVKLVSTTVAIRLFYDLCIAVHPEV